MVLAEQLILMAIHQPVKLILLRKDVLREHLLHSLMLALLGLGRVLDPAEEQQLVVLPLKLLADRITTLLEEINPQPIFVLMEATPL